jgi:3-methyl-2-oxobutanoate hydroxymethyltransferase
MSEENRSRRKVTIATLDALRRRGESAVFVTAYDYPTAVYASRGGVDGILVGDSAAMTMLGHPGTVSITVDEMLMFARAVCRGAGHAFVIGDLPFLSYQTSDRDAVRNAGAFIAAGCDAVKCEGGTRIARRVRAMTDAGIAVMGHIGLTPQSFSQLGGYRVQGRTPEAVQRLADDAVALQDAGCFAVLIEAVPPEAAAYVRDKVSIPLYGIGAGASVDGQLVIGHDLLGSFVGEVQPRFVRRYADIGAQTEQAFGAYARDVRSGCFPAPEHCYSTEQAPTQSFRHGRKEASVRALTAAGEPGHTRSALLPTPN